MEEFEDIDSKETGGMVSRISELVVVSHSNAPPKSSRAQDNRRTIGHNWMRLILDELCTYENDGYDVNTSCDLAES